jgi:hypothetical protein
MAPSFVDPRWWGSESNPFPVKNHIERSSASITNREEQPNFVVIVIVRFCWSPTTRTFHSGLNSSAQRLVHSDQCAPNLSRKHQPKPNLHTEVYRNRTKMPKKCIDKYQTLVQGLIKGCREWNRPRKWGESVVLFVEVLGTKPKYLSLVLSVPEWNWNRQESWWNTTRVLIWLEPLLCKCFG